MSQPPAAMPDEPLFPPWEFVVEPSGVQKFADAVKLELRHRGNGEIAVPLTYPIVASAEHVVRLIVQKLNLDRSRVLHGEQRYTCFRPLRVGDRLSCQMRLLDDRTKPGRRAGTMRVIVREVEMRDVANGELVLVERTTTVELQRAETAQ